MTIVEARTDLWEILAGRATGKVIGPADPSLWQAVSDRLNSAEAAPCLRAGVEVAQLTSARGPAYVMLRSPDPREPCHLRLTPEEWALVERMDGQRSVARLVAEFARITNRLAPEQVTRVVADLAANRMLEPLPVDALGPLSRVEPKPLPRRVGAAVLALLRGRRIVLAGVDPVVGALYKAGGRLLFTRVGAALAGLVAMAGLVAFGWLWLRGDQSLFLIGDSYVIGALALLGLTVVALAAHELGHALAVRHAGRNVPAAGLYLYFGIPSVVVDTTDVWMAGRRDRIRTTAAGPVGAVLAAGGAALLGLVWPPSAPWAFKLAFAGYLHTLFHLSPLFSLDGYYLLTDWLEVPNLRARARTWIAARVRRRPPRFGQLDSEGRLIALYGMLALGWLVVAALVAWRIYADRIDGLVTGLWYRGWAARALLAAVVIGLVAPLVYALGGQLARGWRRWRQRVSDGRVDADLAPRLNALRGSAFGGLAGPALGELARSARWQAPADGQQLIDRGSILDHVLVVVDGVAEARRPGDPGGVIRQRVGPGGVIGLANALTGNPSSFAWYAMGATLLNIPTRTLVTVLGQLPAPAPEELAELEDLLDETPQFATLSAEAYLGATARAEMLHLRPGAPVVLRGPADAALVAAGAVDRYDGHLMQRGGVLGPFGNEEPGEAGTARTQARVWRLPALATMSPLPPAAIPLAGAGIAHPAPMFGAHPPAEYPPLAIPPGPPPRDLDRELDGRFERGLWWLLSLVLLIGLVISGANFWPAPAWAELPADRASLAVSAGTVTVDGALSRLGAGAERHVAPGNSIDVAAGSSARLVFRGGAVIELCAATSVTLDELANPAGHPSRPAGALTITNGRVLADTASTSSAFQPFALTLRTTAGPVVTAGAVRLTAEPAEVQLASGSATLAGSRVPPTGGAPRCGAGTAPAQAADNPGTVPSSAPVPPSATPAESSASVSPPPSQEPSTSLNRSAPPSVRPGTTRPVPPPPSPPPPPPASPVIGSGSAAPNPVCNNLAWSVSASATDADDPPTNLTAQVSFTTTGASGGPIAMTGAGGNFTAAMPTLSLQGEDRQINITVTVADDDGHTATRVFAAAWTATCP